MRLHVGQGSAAILQSVDKEGVTHTLLFDCGSDRSHGSTVIAVLQKMEITKIDAMVLTHWDSDHISQAVAVLRKFEVGRLYSAAYEPEETRTYRTLRDEIDSSGITEVHPASGDKYTFGQCILTFVGPTTIYKEENANSLSAVVSDGKSSIWLGGDTTTEVEEDLLAAGLISHVDIYLVNHHGSSSSSSRDFVKALSPEYAIISCCDSETSEESYGHPTEKVLSILKEADVKLYRTDKQGDIDFSFTRGGVEFTLEPTGCWEAGELKAE